LFHSETSCYDSRLLIIGSYQNPFSRLPSDFVVMVETQSLSRRTLSNISVN
jgi:hypothetical protein